MMKGNLILSKNGVLKKFISLKKSCLGVLGKYYFVIYKNCI